MDAFLGRQEERCPRIRKSCDRTACRLGHLGGAEIGYTFPLQPIRARRRLQATTAGCSRPSTLKGSGQNLGAAELGRVCQALENAGEHEDITEAKAMLLPLSERVSYALKRLAAEDQGSAVDAS